MTTDARTAADSPVPLYATPGRLRLGAARRRLVALAGLLLLAGVAMADPPSAAPAAPTSAAEVHDTPTYPGKPEGWTPPFTPGERLTGTIGWGFLNVGTVVFEVRQMTEWNGEPCYKFVMEARTNAVADKIYKVREHVESYVSTDMARSLHFVKNHEEGGDTKEITVDFDWDKNEATYANYGKARTPIAVTPETQDVLSVFYALRWSYEAGATSITKTVTDGKKSIDGEITLVGTETLKVAGKKTKTMKLEPELKDLGGVFKKTDDAKLHIWVTKDERLVPVLIKSKVIVGSFVVEITKIEQVDFDAVADAATVVANGNGSGEPGTGRLKESTAEKAKSFWSGLFGK